MCRSPLVQLACGFLVLLLAGAACAQQRAKPAAYPERPVRVIVPVAAGGSQDVIKRAVLTRLSDVVGRPFVVDNRPGAGGIIGTDIVAKAQPDGYTLLYTYAAHTIVPFIYSSVPYDVHRDFAPVTLTGSQPLLLAVHASVKANTVQELIELARAHPGKLNVALATPSGSGALAAELFKMVTQTQMVSVPFKGAVHAMPALLSGEVQLIFTSLPTVLPHMKSGKVRVLGTAGRERSPFLPEVPTLIESGIKDFNTAPWQGLLAPARTPGAIVDFLHRRVAEVLRMPQTRERLTALGTDVAGTTPQEFAALLKRELEQNAKVIRTVGMKAD
jgi:tripartite-type tricarboxylate transporter receptor subunit TctC